ncbi:MAG: glycosyltransferase family A protein [Patescibacteria group bacterium]|nr:glycosyltransferase family A protein [Patescibacteria group bacterium]
MIEISVVIPIYNAAKTIEKCLASIYLQTFKKIEIIIVNDGSTDNSLEIVKKYQDKITIINQTNGGAAKARNEGAKIAKAPFIIFCDADVTMKPKMLATMLQTLTDHPKASYAYSSFKFGLKSFALWPFDPEKLKKMPYIHTTSLIRRADFPGFDKKLHKFQDWDLWLTMLARGQSGVFINQELFTIASGGTMSQWLPKFLYHLPFLPAVKKYQTAEKIIKEKHGL